ncbi:hypothetical protein Q7C36_003894 [Tachysurus vachellii]|uniref:Uncharacterized protein n=1 Tax=Tachysurus vachellii TaxID=175792 RepID=A0AA88NX32_TACVA|nr:hypothetical protein Q7C36_003894 [Tachysurus vachellii]
MLAKVQVEAPCCLFPLRGRFFTIKELTGPRWSDVINILGCQNKVESNAWTHDMTSCGLCKRCSGSYWTDAEGSGGTEPNALR